MFMPARSPSHPHLFCQTPLWASLMDDSYHVAELSEVEGIQDAEFLCQLHQAGISPISQCLPMAGTVNESI